MDYSEHKKESLRMLALQEQMTWSDSYDWNDGNGGVDRLLNKINDM